MRLTVAFLTICTGLLLLNCQSESKKEKIAAPAEEIPVTSVIPNKYKIGDSIGIVLREPAGPVQMQFGGGTIIQKDKSSDTLFLHPDEQKTGWHKLIVKGTTAKKIAFADTINLELLSDIIPQKLSYTFVSRYPHQKTSFTEGLEFHKGVLYEGTGENGKSLLLKLDLKTGATLQSVPMADQYFGEGITIVNDKIYQLTWQSGLCFRYDLNFRLDKTFTYYNQGWGLTHNGTTLIMSDGSNKLHFFNPDLEKTGEVEVYDNNGLVVKLNELEFVNGFIYANIFETNRIVQIDPSSGKVLGYLDMEGIIPADINSKKDVMNGIAFEPLKGTFFITGKNWPYMFEIRISGSAAKKKQVASR